MKHLDKTNGGLTDKEIMKRFDEIGVLCGGKNAEDGLKIFNRVLSDFDLAFPKTDEKNIPLFVSKVDVTRLGNNPVKLDSDDLTAIYTEIFRR